MTEQFYNDCRLCKDRGQHAGVENDRCACCGKPVADMDEDESWNMGLI